MDDLTLQRWCRVREDGFARHLSCRTMPGPRLHGPCYGWSLGQESCTSKFCSQASQHCGPFPASNVD
ncbi:hypothetical protein CH063_09296 [Colletotrichum higginsianum]|uniref:Uncharacterized protein n=1 Tax=Colletotrichum higginsianum (strain IMI 349063) TaxID=759273 RepID=H1VD26_COLHI|nr:hypothetical protein CH063_09296 [Colletotrichum higginsianum]